ncbi:hypothetical protein ALC60_05792 [Trachymyrmex zeteki]|uniref:Uncharacterized protein n=1 Tax=Mycetomoellerius zeteki TaxID=64791 RepID=A0A151X426_9HYME|nr:hypothetical protein ALC60_05792 [Trachymyrmex zeteki]
MLNHFHHRIHSYRIKLECNDLSMINQTIIAYDFKNSSAKSALKGCSGSGSFTKAIKAWITAMQELTLVCFCSWFPVFRAYNWQTYLTLFIYIWMIYLCFKIYSWWFKGVFCRKIDFDAKCAFVIRNETSRTESHEDSRTCTLYPRARILGYVFPRRIRRRHASTYRQYQALPVENIGLVYLNICEVLHRRRPEVAEFLEKVAG